MNFRKIFNFFTCQKSLLRKQKTRYQLEENFLMHVSDKGLISRIYKNIFSTHLQFNKKV